MTLILCHDLKTGSLLETIIRTRNLTISNASQHFLEWLSYIIGILKSSLKYTEVKENISKTEKLNAL